MRRKDKEISDISAIEAVIRDSVACRLAMTDGQMPYVVPLCFGYRDNTLYFHAALEGKKLEILRKNSNVCFEFDVIGGAKESEEACNWSMRYRSVIGYGKAIFLEDLEEKAKAFDIIMSQYSDGTYQFPASKLNATAVIRVEIESMTGKQSGFL